MEKQSEHKILESVIQMTKERNKHSLAQKLLQTLSDVIHCDAIVMLRIPRSRKDNHLQVLAASPNTAIQHHLTRLAKKNGETSVMRNEGASHCIDTDTIITIETNDVVRTLFPISVNHVVTGILDVYGEYIPDDTKTLVESYIAIYCNYLALINDNEHDTLTGLLNRKTFDHHLAELVSELNPKYKTDNERRNKKDDTCRWLGILDIDRFKSINDNFGHVYGDEVLLLFAEIMKESFRSSDLLFRYGGEEFVVVLIPSTEEDARLTFERFRQTLERYKFPQIGQVTVSIGMVRIDSDTHSSSVLSFADQALYYAKQHGRNQLCDYHALIKAGMLTVRKIDSDIEIF
ncbi:MAG: GGDEF domain-containing protein [Gammaproteobacteria bacterium]|nr:GGDEF domain-containing protein [Gammaproteobacteria bacterium]